MHLESRDGHAGCNGDDDVIRSQQRLDFLEHHLDVLRLDGDKDDTRILDHLLAAVAHSHAELHRKSPVPLDNCSAVPQHFQSMGNRRV